jgi:hypothetical protein
VNHSLFYQFARAVHILFVQDNAKQEENKGCVHDDCLCAEKNVREGHDKHQNEVQNTNSHDGHSVYHERDEERHFDEAETVVLLVHLIKLIINKMFLRPKPNP